MPLATGLSSRGLKNNPHDGGNWELLGLYGYDNEHSRNLWLICLTHRRGAAGNSHLRPIIHSRVSILC